MPTAPDSCEVDVAGAADRGGRFVQPAAAWAAKKIKAGPQLLWLAQNVKQEMGGHLWPIARRRSSIGAGEFIDISEDGSNLFLPAVRTLVQPEVDGLLHRRRLEWQHYFSSFTGRGIAGIEGMHYDQAIFSRDFWGFFSAYALGEVREFLRGTVVPQFLKYGVSPTYGAGGLFSGIAVTSIAVGRESVAHMQAGVSNACFAVDLDAIVHASATRPTVLDQR